MTLYTHDCRTCIALGAWRGCDLYFHPHCPTVVARYGDSPADYTSGIGLRHDKWLVEAERLARERGFIK